MQFNDYRLTVLMLKPKCTKTENSILRLPYQFQLSFSTKIEQKFSVTVQA